MNEELDSQLSAMFDNELPAAQCELLARRLSRDEELKARWSRYAAIGATMREEGGLRLNAELARRVSVAISAEPPAITTPDADSSTVAESTLVGKPMRSRSRGLAARWWTPVGGVAVAASVAAAAILWVRYESAPQNSPAITRSGVATGGTGVVQSADTLVASNTNTPDHYVVPKTNPRRTIVPATQLANYIVAHSEFSSPVNQRNLLSTLMSESGTAGAQPGSDEPTEDANDDAKSPQ
jgi:sigma-E factor negative regulatory protein RseA